MAGELLGQGHRQILQDLKGQLDAARTSGAQNPIIILEGPSGAGKSFVIRELYSYLQLSQTSPHYWPSIAAGTISRGTGFLPSDDPMPERKRLGPNLNTMRWQAASLPTYSWWTLNCEHYSSGDPLHVVTALSPLLQQHLAPVRLAWSRLAGWPQRLLQSKVELVRAAQEAGEQGVVDAAGWALEKAGHGIPPLGTAVELLKLATRPIRHYFNAQANFEGSHNPGTRAAIGEDTAARVLGHTIAQHSHPDLPAIIVVEDLHKMSREVGEFLDAATRNHEGGTVMVVGTVWPEGTNNQLYRDWSRRAGAVVWHIPNLLLPDRIRMVKEHAPSIRESTARSIADTYTNPYALRLFLTDQEISPLLSRDEGDLVEENLHLQHLPRDIEGFYRRRWSYLAPASRDTLFVAAATLPADYLAWHFQPIQVRAVASAVLEHLTDRDVAERLREATQRGWLLEESEQLVRFTEPLLARIAKEDRSSHQQSEVARLAAYYFQLAFDRLRNGRMLLNSVTTANVQLLIAVLRSAHGEQRLTPASIAALITNAELLARDDPIGALECLGSDFFTDVLRDVRDPDMLLVWLHQGSWLVSAGRLGDAEKHYRRMALELDQVDGAVGETRLMAKAALAEVLEANASMADAAQVARETLNAVQDTIDGANRKFIFVRYSLAMLLHRLGQIVEAQSALKELLPDSRKLLDNPTFALAVHISYAETVSLDDNPEAFAAVWSEVYEEARTVVGPYHERTLTARENVLLLPGLQHHSGVSVLLGIMAVVEVTRELGVDHRRTFMFRRVLAVAYSLAGSTHRSLATMHRLLADQDRVLGADHKETLYSRDMYVRMLRRAGFEEQATKQVVLMRGAEVPAEMRAPNTDKPSILSEISYYPSSEEISEQARQARLRE